VRLRLSSLLSLLLLLGAAATGVAAQLGAPMQGGGFVVFGRVNLPDGKPASRVRVYLEMPNGLQRNVLSDDGGNYEFRGVTGGRYKVRAVNPDAPEQYSDPAESDSTRAYANRVQIHIYLRLPTPHGKSANSKPGTVSAAEMAQEIPKPARQAYERGLRLQKENQPDKALAQFNQAVELYPEYFQALTERANLAMQQNRLAEASADFERALELNNNYSPALRGAGYCNIQLRRFEAAVGQLEKSLTREPHVALTHLLLGYAHLSLNRYEQARPPLEKALKLGADSAARARVYLAEVLAHEGKFKEAADEVRAYLRVKPDAADAESLKKLEAEWRARGKATK
jgi:tetratricopeptide (TPR) repeat protein